MGSHGEVCQRRVRRAQEMSLVALQVRLQSLQAGWQFSSQILVEMVVLRFFVRVQERNGELADLLKPHVLAINKLIDLKSQQWL